jgi:hypothetical protein
MLLTDVKLAELTPSANTPSVLFTSASGLGVYGFITVHNTSNAVDTIRIGLVPSGNVLSATSYIMYNVAIQSNQTTILEDVAIKINDSINVYSIIGVTDFTFTGTVY